MARNVAHMDALVVCAMDARRNQIYNALFTAEGGRLTRRTPDRAIGLSELAEELRGEPLPLVIVGDGGSLCEKALAEAGLPCRLAPPHLVMQNAVSVALCGEDLARAGETGLRPGAAAGLSPAAPGPEAAGPDAGLTGFRL